MLWCVITAAVVWWTCFQCSRRIFRLNQAIQDVSSSLVCSLDLHTLSGSFFVGRVGLWNRKQMSYVGYELHRTQREDIGTLWRDAKGAEGRECGEGDWMSDLGVWESVLGSSSEVWVRSPAEMRFGAVLTSKCGCWSYFVCPNSGAALYAESCCTTVGFGAYASLRWWHGNVYGKSGCEKMA